MRYEQANEAEGKEWLGFIDSLNADCAAQHRVQRTAVRLSNICIVWVK